MTVMSKNGRQTQVAGGREPHARFRLLEKRIDILPNGFSTEFNSDW